MRINVGLTAFICLGLILYTYQTKWNPTLLGGVVLVAVLILIVYSIVMPNIHHENKTTLFLLSVAAFLLSNYWIYDTQKMMEGTHRYSISPNEYVFAALNLNLDMTLFCFIIVLVLRFAMFFLN